MSTDAPVWPPRSAAEFPRLGSLPAYVFAQINAEKMERIAAGEDVIDLGMGNPDIGTPGHIVDEMVAHAADHKHHRYSASRGIYGLRDAMAEHYARRYGVELDSESEVVVTIGAKEGIAHLMLAILEAGDTVIVPSPAYPIHSYSVVFAGGRVHSIPLVGDDEGKVEGDALLAAVEQACASTWPRPKALLLSFPNNPTTLSADPAFFERAVEVCRRQRLLLIHDFAYADFSFTGSPPSILQVPGARRSRWSSFRCPSRTEWRGGASASAWGTGRWWARSPRSRATWTTGSFSRSRSPRRTRSARSRSACPSSATPTAAAPRH
jgi:alanine-synthesizing transaminase